MDVNPKNTVERTDSEWTELSQRMQDVQSYWTTQYNYIEADLQFATGDQWTAKARQSRAEKPLLTLNFTQNYINRVVNPIRKHPFGIRVKHNDKKMDHLYQGLIRDIEYRSNASEAYETAFENAVSAGMGFILVSTDYLDNTSLNQTISIERVNDPTSVWIDPTSEKIDGSDMQYAFYVKYVDKKTAQRKYNLEEADYQTGYEDLYRNWIVPDNTIPEMLYYCIKSKTTKRTWLKSGQVIDGPNDQIPEEIIAGQRDIEERHVEVSKYVGGKMVSQTKLETEYIPVVPVYGDRVFENDAWRGYAGLVRLVRDSQSMINYYASAEAQLVQSAPVSPWLIAEGQTRGYEDMWASANTDAYDSLPYVPTSLNGQTVPPPQRMDNTAQTGHLTQSRMSAIEDLQRSTGIFDSSMGQEDISGQSGRAIMLKQNTADISSFHYVDNLTKSITQCGRIVLQLINSIYDTDRSLQVRGTDGATVEIQGNVKESGVPAHEFDTEVEAGPMLQNQKEMTTATVLEIGKMMPEKFSMFADILVKNLDTAGSDEIAERLEKMLPPELLPEKEGEENAPDPQAMAALQQAEQTIGDMEAMMEQYENIIRQQQVQLISDREDNIAKIEEAKIEAEIKLATTEMDNATKIEIEHIKAGSKAESDDKKIAQDSRNRVLDTANEAIQNMETSIGQVIEVTPDNAMDQVERVGGPIGGQLEGADTVADDAVESIDDFLIVD